MGNKKKKAKIEKKGEEGAKKVYIVKMPIEIMKVIIGKHEPDLNGDGYVGTEDENSNSLIKENVGMEIWEGNVRGIVSLEETYKTLEKGTEKKAAFLGEFNPRKEKVIVNLSKGIYTIEKKGIVSRVLDYFRRPFRDKYHPSKYKRAVVIQYPGEGGWNTAFVYMRYIKERAAEKEDEARMKILETRWEIYPGYKLKRSEEEKAVKEAAKNMERYSKIEK